MKEQVIIYFLVLIQTEHNIKYKYTLKNITIVPFHTDYNYGYKNGNLSEYSNSILCYFIYKI